MVDALQRLFAKHAKMITSTGLQDDGSVNDALVRFERVWSDDEETSWPNPELLDAFVSGVEEQWIEPPKRRHGEIVSFFENFLASLEEVGPFIEEMDWMDVEEALLDGLDAAE